MENILDNIKKGMGVALTEAGKLTKVVTKKTVHIYDTTKLNIALNDTQGRVDKHYKKIGEIIYGRYLDNRDVGDEIEGYCEEIDAFMEEIKSLKDKIATLKNSSACPSCGHNNDTSSSFCSKCGRGLSNDDDDVIQVVDVPDESKVVHVVDVVD